MTAFYVEIFLLVFVAVYGTLVASDYFVSTTCEIIKKSRKNISSWKQNKLE